MSLVLAEIDRAAPIDADPEHYRPQPRDTAGCSRLMTRLELFSLMKRMGIPEDAGSPDPVPESAPVRAGLARLPASPEAAARLFAGERVFFLGQFEEDSLTAFSVSDGESALVCRAEDEGFAACAGGLYTARGLVTRQSKALYRHCMKAGRPLPQVALDCELAAYLLRPTASDYTTHRLAAEYAVPSIGCDGDDPAAGRDGGADPAGPGARGQDRRVRPGVPAAGGGTAAGRGAGLDGADRLCAGHRRPGGLRQGAGRPASGPASEIYRLAGEQFNINSPMQLGHILFERLGLPTAKRPSGATPPTPMCSRASGTSTRSST